MAAAGLTTMLDVIVGVRLPLENSSVIVSAVSSPRFVNVAIPPTTVAVTVPWSGPVPLASETVTTVLLSLVTRLPLVLFIDDRLGRERLTGGRCRRRWRMQHKLSAGGTVTVSVWLMSDEPPKSVLPV